MIKVCEHCSNIDLTELKTKFNEDEIQLGCIEMCGEHEGKAYGFVNDELVVKSDSNEWIEFLVKS